MAGFSDGQTDPADAKDAPEVAVRKHGDEAGAGPQAGNEAVGPRGDLGGGFAGGAPVGEDVPARALRMNFIGATAFVVAVIPLGEIGVYVGARGQPAQFAGLPGAVSRTSEDVVEGQVADAFVEFARFVFAFDGQRQIGAAGVVAGERPGGFAMADEVDFERRAGGVLGLATVHFQFLISGMSSPFWSM